MLSRKTFLTAAALGFRFIVTLSICFVLASPPAPAQKKRSSVEQAPARAWVKQQCSQGVELRLTSVDPRQGSLQLVEVTSAVPLGDVTGQWDDNEVPFWKHETTANKDLDTRRALLGIDLDHATGPGNFTISLKTTGGESSTCTVNLTVKPGHFAIEALKVAPQFVEPNPEQLARAQAEQKHLRQIYATLTPEKLWSGKFCIPIRGATTGGNFGKRRVLNGEPSSPHSGVDIAAPAGTAIHAAQRGRVVLAEPLYFSGNTVVVDHGLGVYTLYAHLSAFDTKVGDTLEAGQILGKVGDTGRVTGPHLHWGLTVNRARVNAPDILKLLN